MIRWVLPNPADFQILFYLCPNYYPPFVCINLLRSGERIGSTTHWQPTKSPANTGLENRCQFLLRCKTEDNKLNFNKCYTQIFLKTRLDHIHWVFIILNLYSHSITLRWCAVVAVGFSASSFFQKFLHAGINYPWLAQGYNHSPYTVHSIIFTLNIYQNE